LKNTGFCLPKNKYTLAKEPSLTLFYQGRLEKYRIPTPMITKYTLSKELSVAFVYQRRLEILAFSITIKKTLLKPTIF
jgi:hypothetical protein